ncbi:S-adenosyl-L-methionine-dependent methyltransferase [Daedalea quercina L-15889]|uniref:S-adenosyl-L-methionine-dependent methyltransferase n=1 Tax=Daedalea quercina L-15889 TaxID=1314783 RepID=A0A165U0J7_9APHY|nr:S-adenosyl-L-methionine-dependent methyltransferase [Daedalea quercina L-15889]
MAISTTPQTSSRVETLRSLIQLLVDTSEAVIKEWEAEEHPEHSDVKGSPTPSLPSHALFEARRIMRGACEMCIDLVEDPRHRIQELAETFSLSQAFDTTLRAGVPDILAETSLTTRGVPAAELSRRTGINEKKLVRIMRLLCSGGMYEEVKDSQFTNTHISGVFVANAPARAIQCIFGTQLHVSAIAHLPVTLLDSKWTNATSATEAAFHKAQGTNKTLWELIDQGDDSDANVVQMREVFAPSMVGQGQMGSPALLADFPWGSLKEATVVDVGGGVGSMCIDLATIFQDLRFVIEDLPATIEKARIVWSTEGTAAIETGRVQLLAHDFFAEQPVKRAEVYFLRCVLHDWPDDDCIKILSRLRDAMGPESRILVADIIVHPPLGSKHLTSAPAPLPANYGRANAFKGMRDIAMLSMYNGIERTPEQLGVIADAARLKIEKIWECRGPFSITELRPL